MAKNSPKHMENNRIFAIQMDSWTNTRTWWKALSTNKIIPPWLLNGIISTKLNLWTKTKLNTWVASHKLDVLVASCGNASISSAFGSSSLLSSGYVAPCPLYQVMKSLYSWSLDLFILQMGPEITFFAHNHQSNHQWCPEI